MIPFHLLCEIENSPHQDSVKPDKLFSRVHRANLCHATVREIDGTESSKLSWQMDRGSQNLIDSHNSYHFTEQLYLF